MAGNRRPVARRPEHGLHHPVAVRAPVVEARVAGAPAPLLPADVGVELALGIALLDGQRGLEILLADLLEERLVLRRRVDRLALLGL
jgi:hypothetical protein